MILLPSLSVYISTLNPLFWQATIEATIRQSLLFADEVVVVDGGSTDGTIELIEKLQEEDARILLYHYKDKYELGQASLADKKSFALSKCTSDYVILQDDDEMIHERYAKQIRQLSDDYPDAIGFRFNTIHFYRSWNHYQCGEGWYKSKIYMVQNLPQIQHGKVGRDRDNYLFLDEPLSDMGGIVDIDVMVSHYGHCRSDPVMLLKKYYQEISWWGADYWEDQEFPFELDSPKRLPEYDGVHPKYMLPLIKAEGKKRWVEQPLKSSQT